MPIRRTDLGDNVGTFVQMQRRLDEEKEHSLEYKPGADFHEKWALLRRLRKVQDTHPGADELISRLLFELFRIVDPPQEPAPVAIEERPMQVGRLHPQQGRARSARNQAKKRRGSGASGQGRTPMTMPQEDFGLIHLNGQQPLLDRYTQEILTPRRVESTLLEEPQQLEKERIKSLGRKMGQIFELENVQIRVQVTETGVWSVDLEGLSVFQIGKIFPSQNTGRGIRRERTTSSAQRLQSQQDMNAYLEDARFRRREPHITGEIFVGNEPQATYSVSQQDTSRKQLVLSFSANSYNELSEIIQLALRGSRRISR